MNTVSKKTDELNSVDTKNADNSNDLISEALRKNIEIEDTMLRSIQPVINLQSQLAVVPDISGVDGLVATMETFSRIQDNGMSNALRDLGEVALSTVVPSFSFTNPAIEAINQISKSLLQGIASSLQSIVDIYTSEIVESFNSVIGSWLQTIDFTPLRDLVESLSEFDFDYPYEELEHAYLQAMFEARWFPYAGWIADLDAFGEINTILETSRKSKNRTKRIDAVIFSYYNKNELMNIKRRWRGKASSWH